MSFPSLFQSNLPPHHSLVAMDTDLQFAILGRVMKWGPTPVVGDNFTTMKQQPAEHLGMASAGGKVHRCRTIAIPVGEADLCETHLEG